MVDFVFSAFAVLGLLSGTMAYWAPTDDDLSFSFFVVWNEFPVVLSFAIQITQFMEYVFPYVNFPLYRSHRLRRSKKRRKSSESGVIIYDDTPISDIAMATVAASYFDSDDQASGPA